MRQILSRLQSVSSHCGAALGSARSAGLACLLGSLLVGACGSSGSDQPGPGQGGSNAVGGSSGTTSGGQSAAGGSSSGGSSVGGSPGGGSGGASGALGGSGGGAGRGGSGGGGAAGSPAGGSGGVVSDPDAGLLDASGWRSAVVGGGGFIDGILFHPKEKGLLYVRTDMGGAYRWDEARTRWIPLTDSIGRTQADSLGVLSLALDPSNADLVYMMTGKYTQSWAGVGAILISKDRGVTWTRSPLTVKVGGNEDGRGTGERLVVDPNSGANLLMGTTKDGLWKSSDSAATFTRVTAFTPTNVNFVIYDKASGTAGAATPRIFAGVAGPQSLWSSTDGGGNWAAVAQQPANQFALRAAIADGKLYVTYASAVGPNGAMAGSLWRYDVATGMGADISPPTGSYGFGGVSVDAQKPQHLLVSTLDRWAPRDEVFRSTDGGTSWTPLLTTAIWDRSKAPYSADSTPHWLTDVQIDPFDSERAWFVTGFGAFMTRNLSAAPSKWSFENAGLEQTVPLQLVSPPMGAPLISVMGDIDGFRHDELHASPAAGRHKPLRGTTHGLAFAEAMPSKLVKAHTAEPYGSYSTDGGTTWSGFATAPMGTTGAGKRNIAISSDGATIVWNPTGATLSFSANDGAAWTASTGGVPSTASPVADRVNPVKFYAFDALTGRVFVSTDKGASFGAAASDLPTLPDYSLDDAELSAVFGKEGHLWLAAGAGGLYRSLDSGAAFSKVAGVTAAYKVGFGKAAEGASYPAIYVWATVGGVTGIFRSDDEGKSFMRVNDDQHQFGWLHCVIGDPRVYGRVYLATEGRGIIYR